MIDKFKSLADKISLRMSAARYAHTLGVFEMAEKLADFCLPECKLSVCAAALLHDLTKDLSFDQQIEILTKNNVGLPCSPEKCPQVLHSYTAPFVILQDFPEYSTPEILSAVEKHTVGASHMTEFDEIVFIADYTEKGRKYQQCISVREYILSSMRNGETEHNRQILHKACIMAIDNTIANLKSRDTYIAPDVYLAKKALQAKIL